VQNYFPVSVKDTEVHAFSMKIDSTEKFVLLGVKSHTRPPLEKFLGPESYPVFRYGSRGP
jgi:hypothetical protein